MNQLTFPLEQGFSLVRWVLRVADSSSLSNCLGRAMFTERGDYDHSKSREGFYRR